MPQMIQKPRSEYAQSYRTHKESAQAEYSENVRFRVARRNQEVSHAPWAWIDVGLSDAEESSEGHGSSRRPSGREDRESQTSAGGEKDAVASGASAAGTGGPTAAVSKATESRTVQTTGGEQREQRAPRDKDAFVQELKQRAIKRAMEMRRDCTRTVATGDDRDDADAETQKNRSNSAGRRPHHPLKGNSKTFQHSTSKNTSQKKVCDKPVKSLNSVNTDKMFMSYGFGSQCSENSRKKTFNIKSGIDVYPSAIRASKTRESNKQQKEKPNCVDTGRPKSAVYGKCREPCSARNINLDNQAAMDWLSEYQLRFPIYDNDVYRRGLANLAPRGHFARLDTPRTCRI